MSSCYNARTNEEVLSVIVDFEGNENPDNHSHMNSPMQSVFVLYFVLYANRPEKILCRVRLCTAPYQ